MRVLLCLALLLSSTSCLAQQESLSINFEDLDACELDTQELGDADSKTEVNSCILYDTNPTIDEDYANRTSVITVVGVFASMCHIHRDGAVVAVDKINKDNNGKGAKIGYNGDHYVKFRFIVGIAGNSRQLAPDVYAVAHQELLESMLLTLTPQYILGSCSFYAALDKPLAGKYQTVVLAQVGPESFYAVDSNEYVFGIHIPSETYGIPAFHALRFSLQEKESRTNQKIRIIYRDRSEFFYSTCRSVYDMAMEEGFMDTVAIEYNPEGDADGDGILNQEDEDFLKDLADQACSAEESGDNVAIWGCVLSDFETNTILDRLKENGCRPSQMWLTVASWEYPNQFPENVPFMQSGAQWHKSMKYSDEYFATGQEALDYGAEMFGYNLSYGALGAYHAIYMIYQTTASFVKTKDLPDVDGAYQNQYEELRRHMLGLSIPKSLYGPTSFGANRRNIGRGSAGLQWAFPFGSGKEQFELLLVSPIDQATATVVIPAPAAINCLPGSFINQSLVEVGDSVLMDKCEVCPVDTYEPNPSSGLQCRQCKDGSTTDGETGATICVELEDNLLSNGLRVFGYIAMSTVFALAISFASWTIYHRKDPVVQIGQPEFLLLMCFGSVLSSSSIIPLSIQADALEDTAAASRACMAIPWLYSTGWILQYASLFTKSYRMYRMMKNATAMRRLTVTATSMFKIVFGALLLDWAVIIPWTIIDPLTWERSDLGTTVDADIGVMTKESIGKCTSDSLGAWLGSLLGFHLAIIIITNVLLWNLRTMSDRYQESKFVTMASIFACEIFLIGVPILIAVGDSSEARYIVLCSCIAFTDMGIMLMIFVPKILFQRKGLPEGTSLGSTLFKQKSNIGVSGMDGSVKINQRSNPEAHLSSSYQSKSFGVSPNQILEEPGETIEIENEDVSASAPNDMAEGTALRVCEYPKNKSASIDATGRVSRHPN